MDLFHDLIYFILRPMLALDCLLSKTIYPIIVYCSPSIKIKGKITLKGLPVIYAKSGALITLEKNVTLHSRNFKYHFNMHSPAKLIADEPGAEIIVGENSRINGACINAKGKITIGKNCLIAANTQIFDNNGHGLSFPNVENRINTVSEPEPITIEDNVWIGANCIILPGVTIGSGSVIAAGSIVTNDIPPLTVAAGNPAKVIQEHANTKEQ